MADISPGLAPTKGAPGYNLNWVTHASLPAETAKNMMKLASNAKGHLQILRRDDAFEEGAPEFSVQVKSGCPLMSLGGKPVRLGRRDADDYRNFTTDQIRDMVLSGTTEERNLALGLLRGLWEQDGAGRTFAEDVRKNDIEHQNKLALQNAHRDLQPPPQQHVQPRQQPVAQQQSVPQLPQAPLQPVQQQLMYMPQQQPVYVPPQPMFVPQPMYAPPQQQLPQSLPVQQQGPSKEGQQPHAKSAGDAQANQGVSGSQPAGNASKPVQIARAQRKAQKRADARETAELRYNTALRGFKRTSAAFGVSTAIFGVGLSVGWIPVVGWIVGGALVAAGGLAAVGTGVAVLFEASKMGIARFRMWLNRPEEA